MFYALGGFKTLVNAIFSHHDLEVTYTKHWQAPKKPKKTNH